MGGEIKVVKKDGPGTLMRLYLLLRAPVDSIEQNCQVDFAKHNLVVLLALHGKMDRLIMSQWLHKIGVFTLEASEWNELTQILQELFRAKSSVRDNGFDAQSSLSEGLKAKLLKIQDMVNPVFIIAVDIGLLDLSTDIWKEQINFLDNYFGKAKFAWMLYHDTSNAVKMELRRKGNILMVNKPLYKAKMIHILEAVIKEKNLELQKKSSNGLRTTKEGDLHECLEIDATHLDIASSDDSDMSEMGRSNSVNGFHTGEKQRVRIRKPCSSGYKTINNCLVEFTPVYSKENDSTKRDPCQIMPNSHDIKDEEPKCCTQEASFSTEPQSENAKCQDQHLVISCPTQQGNLYSNKAANEQKSLEGLRILLAEDNPVLQRVATIMLEKMGATVIAVGDGLQAVDALNCKLSAEDFGRESLFEDRNTRPQTEIKDSPPYDLILMDCQMPKMDGYEATKLIRKSETGTRLHIPIVALTAHAMSSDEAKCLEVGMDAYLTKPIDYKRMVSTILSLTKRMT